MHPSRLREAAVRWGSWAALSIGAVLLVIGWYGISGERFTERQLPYLASCTIPGAALIIAGAVLLARGDQGLAAARVDELYALLLASDGDMSAEGQAARKPSAEDYLTVPGGSLFHRADCPLVSGKEQAETADADTRRSRSLTPCPVCEPAPAPET